MELFSGKKTKNLILDHLIEILLLALIIGVSIAAPSFLKSGNILNILRNLDRIATETPGAFETLRKILSSENNRLDELPGTFDRTQFDGSRRS